MFPHRHSQLLLSCILLVVLVQLPWSESRPATERTDTGETLHGSKTGLRKLVIAALLIKNKKKVCEQKQMFRDAEASDGADFS